MKKPISTPVAVAIGVVALILIIAYGYHFLSGKQTLAPDAQKQMEAMQKMRGSSGGGTPTKGMPGMAPQTAPANTSNQSGN